MKETSKQKIARLEKEIEELRAIIGRCCEKTKGVLGPIRCMKPMEHRGSHESNDFGWTIWC